tara:strand:- start:271 stop:930 length:660 start_codon:yes stop_codon:yes gene_type:complete
MMLDKIEEQNHWSPVIIDNSNSTIELNKIDNLFSSQLTEWGHMLLPPMVQLKFDSLNANAFPPTAQKIDDIPEHICCEFLNYMDNPINRKATEQKYHDLSDGWSTTFIINPSNFESQMGVWKSYNYKELTILLRKNGEVNLNIAVSFWLNIDRAAHSVGQEESWVRIYGKYDADKLYEYWMRGATKPDEALSIVPGEYLEKKEIISWFNDDLDLFWWFE